MKRIHPEDPRVTAYALGELSRAEAAELERAALLNPAVQEALDETRELAALLGNVLGDRSLALDEDRREAIRRAGRRPEAGDLASASRYRRWGRAAAVLAAAAVLVLGGVWILQQIPVAVFGDGGEVAETREETVMRLLLSPVNRPRRVARIEQGAPLAPERPSDPAAGKVAGEEWERLLQLLREDPDAFYQDVHRAARGAAMRDLAKLPELADNVFVASNREAQAVVPMVSGRASFPLVERFVRGDEKLPPLSAVRVEELVNHVNYQDEGDAVLDGIRLGAELVRCPWNEKRSLLGILLRNDSEELLPVSPSLRMELNPEVIRSYRLVGYAEPEDGAGRKGSGVQPGLPPGWSNFVLYELNPATQQVFDEIWQAVRVGLALGQDEPRALIVPVMSPPRDWVAASSNFKTASVLAAYGMLLRNSRYRGDLEPGLMGRLAREALADASAGDLRQREALQLVIDSEQLLIAAGR